VSNDSRDNLFIHQNEYRNGSNKREVNLTLVPLSPSSTASGDEQRARMCASEMTEVA